jgi:hypothetical protein
LKRHLEEVQTTVKDLDRDLGNTLLPIDAKDRPAKDAQRIAALKEEASHYPLSDR